jgi:tRNA(Ile)-lysidine synthase
MGEVPLQRRVLERLLVALSGGLDSTVLLHLLRFHRGELPLELVAAHFDHRLRPSSAGDAAWTRGLCHAWQVPLESGVASGPLRGEAGAREARYAFLRSCAVRLAADHIVTAHHADDQAETVLFRILRGTGLGGLGGIPARTRSGLLRPLLPFWRIDLETYAGERGLAWRTDPTNAGLGPARNRIRLELLPRIEREIAPGARRNLVSLAALARESEMGWRAVVEPLFERLVTSEGDDLLVRRDDLRGLEPAIRTRLLREALRRFGIGLDLAGTRSAVTFITDAASGREFQLPQGVRIRTEFGVARIGKSASVELDSTLRIEALSEGESLEAAVRLGGRRWRFRVRVTADAGAAPLATARWWTRIPLDDLRFPLEVRARRPGDRIRTASGSRSLKKLMIDRRIPARERARLPVLTDARGTVLWLAGLDTGPPPPPGRLVLAVEIADE